MLRSLDRRTIPLLRGLTLLLSALFVLLFLAVAWRRLHYPFELDRMESGMVTSVWRLRHGAALYSPPSLSWAPFLYAPLFFYVSAAVSKVLGVGYAALRLVSILATLGSFALIFALVYTESRPRWQPALFATGVYASLYAFVLAWFDVGRVDSLALFFFLAALWLTRRGLPVAAALMWWLAFLTKQTFLPFGLAIFLVDWQRPRRMLTGMLSYATLVAATILWLQHTTHGWFGYYAFGTTGVIRWSLHNAIMFPFNDLLGPLPVAVALVAIAAAVTHLRWRQRDGTFFGITTVLITAAIWYVRAHEGANLNAVIPLYAWLAVLAGVALDRLLLRAAQPDLTPALGKGLSVVLWFLATIQLLQHLYRPAEIPTGNLVARQSFLQALRDTPGDVWVVDHSYDAILAGKPIHADMDALDAVLGRHHSATVQAFQEAISQGAFTAVVLDREAEAYQPAGLFTTPPFSSIYRLRALTPGGAAAGELDQPRYTLLPCSVLDGKSHDLTDTSHGMVDRSACAHR